MCHSYSPKFFIKFRSEILQLSNTRVFFHAMVESVALWSISTECHTHIILNFYASHHGRINAIKRGSISMKCAHVPKYDLPSSCSFSQMQNGASIVYVVGIAVYNE